jgi:hypothetical protein
VERSVKCIKNLIKVFLQIRNDNVGMSNENNWKTIVTVSLRFSTLNGRFERSLKKKAKAFFEKL